LLGAGQHRDGLGQLNAACTSADDLEHPAEESFNLTNPAALLDT
jgi:hypothetical protein